MQEKFHNTIILLEFLLFLLHSLFFPLLAALPSCVLLPPLGSPAAPDPLPVVPRMNTSMLRWIFGVLYVAIAFCLPRLSLWYFLALFQIVCVVGCLLQSRVSLVFVVSEAARKTELWIGLKVVELLSIVVGLAPLVQFLPALFVLLLKLVRSIAPRQPLLMSWIRLFIKTGT